jgi:hypothetical protein
MVVVRQTYFYHSAYHVDRDQNYFFPINFFFAMKKSLRKLIVFKYIICVYTYNKINIFLPAYHTIDLVNILRNFSLGDKKKNFMHLNKINKININNIMNL